MWVEFVVGSYLAVASSKLLVSWRAARKTSLYALYPQVTERLEEASLALRVFSGYCGFRSSTFLNYNSTKTEDPRENELRLTLFLL